MKTFKQRLQENEKLEYFLKRTKEHIDRVKNNAEIIVRRLPELQGLLNQVEMHDQSKYEDPEREPYIELSWNYKIGEPERNSEDWIHRASEHHVKHNKHHPEYWDNDDSPTINHEDRDKLLRLIDGRSMDDISIAEMVCDWQSMSQEYNEGSCRGWADKNVNVKWNFTKKQKQLIYKIIDIFEDENI